MRHQTTNPFLPLNAYIPDGEPHVFGDRVYLFGSHDKEGGERFCMLDYEGWSAPVDDLSDWRSEGVIYRAEQDPVSQRTGKRITLAAPDAVRGNDGRYYLYYTTDGFQHPISVAVCDRPMGKYQFHGTLRNPDGSPYQKRIPFDPAVLNDDGVIRLYYGWALHLGPNMLMRPSVMLTSKMLFGKYHETDKPGSIMGAYTVELAEDMLTVKTEPKLVAPGHLEAKGTSFWDHSFYEGSSIRKIGNTYYFIYSSHVNHELCYATSKYPDRDFRYCGVIISNGDVGYKGRKLEDRVNTTGNNHGSIECINGQWYIFYHRHTHNTSFSRQACAEKIQILPDGSIPQVEMTSCGLNDGPLKAEGAYPAVICCNLFCGKMKHIVNGISKADRPFISHDASDPFITGIQDGTNIVYKYLDFAGRRTLSVWTRGNAQGTLVVWVNDRQAGKITMIPSESWTMASTEINVQGTAALRFVFSGEGRFDLKEFAFEE